MSSQMGIWTGMTGFRKDSRSLNTFVLTWVGHGFPWRCRDLGEHRNDPYGLLPSRTLGKGEGSVKSLGQRSPTEDLEETEANEKSKV